MGILTLSDQTGHFEAILFSEGLQRYRDILEPGSAVVLMVQAGLEGDEVRARIGTAEPLEEAVAKHQKGMRIFLRDERPIGSVFERLKVRGEGEVSLVLILDDGDREVEVKLPGKYMASPQIAGRAAGRAGRGGRAYELGSPRRVVRDSNSVAPRFSGFAEAGRSRGGLACSRTVPRATVSSRGAARLRPPIQTRRGGSRRSAPCFYAFFIGRFNASDAGGRPVRSTAPRRLNRRKTMALPDFSMRQLLEAGAHFGHQSHRWNPKMGQYIFGTRNNIHIIDLAQTVPMLHRALQAVSDTVAKGGRVLFVGTKRQAADAVADAAKRSAQYYVNSRWLGGMLTNWKTISGSISRLRKVDEILAGGGAGPHQEGAPDARPARRTSSSARSAASRTWAARPT